MLVEQISVFIENQQGRLSEVADLLAQNEIDISALSLADTDEYGVIRMIVNHPHKAKEVLASHGIIGKVTNVLAVAIDDSPGGFAKSLKTLTEKGIGINYMYACVSHEKGKALMILSVDDVVLANSVIADFDGDNVDPTSIYRI